MSGMAPVVLIPHALGGMNIYVDELSRAYRSAGCDVIFGIDNLFEANTRADIVHLQWPEEFYRWTTAGGPERRAERLLSGLDAYRARGSRVVWTVHNVVPHDQQLELDRKVYEGIVARTDLMLHHCPRSIEIVKQRYDVPERCAHAVAPHGNYAAYPSGVGRPEARRALAIPDDAYVFLHFGAIRGYKGLDLLLRAFRGVRHPQKWLLVAGKYTSITGRGRWRERMTLAITRRLSPRVTLHLHAIPSEQLQRYVAASDCVVLSHTAGLNSGVAILGMTFGKLIVGPRLGCIEWVLNAGSNLTFDTGSVDALRAAMDRAPLMDRDAVCRSNLAATARWTWEGIVQVVLAHPCIASPAPEVA
jgi:beta-1,4-mannosyltransferase